MKASRRNRPWRRLAGAVVAVWAAAALALSGTLLAAQPAAAADPSCALVPASLSAEVTKDPADGLDTVEFAFEGQLQNGAESGCVWIRADENLPLRGLGTVDALDKTGAKLGSMTVSKEGIRFDFLPTYLKTHSDVTFRGTVTSGVKYTEETFTKGETITWDLVGKSAVTVTVLKCPDCYGKLPEYASKWAGIDKTGTYVNSGIRIGTKDLAGLSDPVQVTVEDTLTAGQKCRNVRLETPSGDPKKPTVIATKDVTWTCSADKATISFKATPGMAYEVRVDADITDKNLKSYGDTAVITAQGREPITVTKTASWQTGSASGDGTGKSESGTSGSSTEGSGTNQSDGGASVPSTEAPSTDTPGTGAPDTETGVTPPKPDTPGPGTSDTPGTGTPDTPVTPVTPAPAPEAGPGPNRQEKPWIPSPAPKGKVWRSFQVDRYAPRSAVQARRVAGFDDDGRLGYREDRVMWGASRWQFVTVLVPVKATQGELFAAINAQSGKRIGLLTTTRKLPSARAGQVYVMAWELGRDAAPVLGRAWGPRHATPQTFVGRG